MMTPPGETVGGTGDGIEAVDELRAGLHEAKEQQAVKDQEIARLQEQLRERGEIQEAVEFELRTVGRI